MAISGQDRAATGTSGGTCGTTSIAESKWRWGSSPKTIRSIREHLGGGSSLGGRRGPPLTVAAVGTRRAAGSEIVSRAARGWDGGAVHMKYDIVL